MACCPLGCSKSSTVISQISSILGPKYLSMPQNTHSFFETTSRNVRNMYNVLDQPWLVVCKNDEKGHIVSFNAKADLLDFGYLAMGEWETIAKNIDPLS